MNLFDALGWTLLHSLWQGTLIAFFLWAVTVFFGRENPRARYGAACTALLLILVCAGGTFGLLRFTQARPQMTLREAGIQLANISLLSIHARPSIAHVQAAARLPAFLPAIVWAWLAGVLALSVRSLGGWVAAQRFARTNTTAAEPLWETRVAVLARRLSISGPVRLAVSTLARVPAVIGWLRPVVLVPASVFMGLTPDQIEALLAHELAHVRRHDYLVNLLQTALETLMFYHPAVWWVSHVIRNEREHCCDDLAVAICGDKLLYVRALTGLEQIRDAGPRLAMAADGGSLLSRVQRLLESDRGNIRASSWLAGLLGAAACLLAIGLAADGFAQQPGKPRTELQLPASPAKPDADDWLTGVQAEGYRDLTLDQLIALKIHGVDSAYIRQMHTEGSQLTADQLVAFRVHGITDDFIGGLKQAGMQNLKADQVIALKIHGAEPAVIREIQASLGSGAAELSVDQIIALRIHGITPAFIRDAKSRFRDITLDQLIQLKRLGILRTP